MPLPDSLFDYLATARGSKYPFVRSFIPGTLLTSMGLQPGDGTQEDLLHPTQIPVHSIQGIRECCVYTADFGTILEHPLFPPPVQLVTIPCRCPSGIGKCTKLGSEKTCSLFCAPAYLLTSKKERVELIALPLFPGNSLSEEQIQCAVRMREKFVKSLRLWEEMFAPLHLVVDATNRGMQFWVKAWFG
ncbi:MAG: hypothetical protein HQM04_09330 [Magnetococcales bacterium]|nr:hypothetical protein [Magnetococcales bacterium]MBF0115234.1 hypothetical protein [Magnetococcales bacterium]